MAFKSLSSRLRDRKREKKNSNFICIVLKWRPPKKSGVCIKAVITQNNNDKLATELNIFFREAIIMGSLASVLMN